MAKGKAKAKANLTVPHKNVYLRMSYLYQAATYLSHTTEHANSTVKEDESTSNDTESAGSRSSQTKFLLNQIRGVTRKAQIGLHSELKRTICKRCDALLLPGQTATVVVENASKNGQKAWADVLVLKCNGCQFVKRFPVGQTRKTKGSDIAIKHDTRNCT